MLLANIDILMKALEITDGVCARDHLEDGLFLTIQMDILKKFYTASIYSACVYIDNNEM